MTRLNQVLLIVIVVELVGAAAQLWRRAARPAIPPVNLSAVDAAMAEEIARLQSDLQPDNANHWYELGQIYRAGRFFRQSEYCYRRAVGLSPELMKAQYALALVLDWLGEMEAAVAQYERAMELGADAANCWVYIGDLNLRMEWVEQSERAAEAERAYREAVLANPAHETARMKLVHLYLKTGRVDDAVPLIDRLEEMYPNLIFAYQAKSRALAMRGENELALEYEERSRRADGHLHFSDRLAAMEALRSNYGAGAYRRQSIESLQNGRLDAALRAGRRTLELDWSFGTAMQTARVALQMQQPAEVIEILEDVIRRSGADSAVLNMLGDAYTLLGEQERARDLWERGTRLKRTHKITEEIHQKLADWYQTRGKPDKWRHHRAMASYEAARQALHRNALAEALSELQRATTLAPDHVPSWFYLGEVQRFRGEADEAQAAYRRCLELDPGHGRALRGLERLT